MIDRDDVFWETKMKTKLLSFYMDWLLPEIVDSPRARGMPLREKESPKLDPHENNPCRKRRLTFEGSPTTVLSCSRDDTKENYLCRKRRLTFEESSTILSTAIGSNKENIPCCSKQLSFDEM